MNAIYKGARFFKDLYNQLNPATLTGAIDILVIEQENEELRASPFHVRFGKLGVLRAKEKLVNITINDEAVDLHMKLGDQGEAFFVVETDDEDTPARLLTSPLPSRPVSPVLGEAPENNRSLSREESTTKRRRRKRRKRRSFSSTSNEMSQDYSQSSDSDEDMHTQVNLPSIDQSPLPKKLHPSEPQLSFDCQELRLPPTFRLTKCYDSGTDSTSINFTSDSESEVDEATSQYKRLCSVFSDSELQQGGDERTMGRSTSPYSDSEAMERNDVSTPVGWEWGELPGSYTEKRKSLCVPLPTHSKSSMTMEKEKKDYPQRRHSFESKSDSVFESGTSKEQKLSTSSEPVTKETQADMSLPSSREGSPKKKRPVEGLYLDEILDLDPNEVNLYFSTKNSEEKSDDNGQELVENQNETSIDNVRSRTPETPPFAPSDAGIDSGTDCVISDDVGETPELSMSPMKISLCGGKFENGKMTVDEEKFNEKLVTFEQFLNDPVDITRNTDLVIQLGDRYCDWETAGPLFLSVCIFKKPLSNEIMERVIDKQISKKLRASSGGRLSWFWRRGSQRDSTSSLHSESGANPEKETEAPSDATNTPKLNNNNNIKIPLMKSYSASPTVTQNSGKNGTDESSSCEDEISKITMARKELKRAQTVQNVLAHQFLTPNKTMRKTTRLTSDQLKSLNLKPGANEISFSVTSQYQGTSRCVATVFLWKSTDRLVVSDIDGTITKSDVFGQILPVVGKDWTQGGVAQLYHNISKNGYKFIYLSARAIGQAGMTKGYLNWINQQGVSLPAGPLFLSPTSLMRAFRQEVIEKKPELFKIQCLEDIKALFPKNSQTLCAGFGNKSNDVVAYSKVDIPKKRIFTINHRGELRQEDLQMYTTSYSELGDIVDTFFPALDSPRCRCFSDTNEYTNYNYWKIESEVFDEDIPN